MLDAGAQRDQKAIYDGRVSIYTLQSNVKRAIVTALNESAPKKYKRVDGGIGEIMYKVNQCLQTILDHLRNLYGRPTPNEKLTTRRCGQPHTIQVTPSKIFLTASKNVS